MISPLSIATSGYFPFSVLLVATDGYIGATPENIRVNGGALNKWYAYELQQEQEEKVDEFVQEYVQELKTSRQINIEPIVLKRIDAIDLLGTAVIQEAIRQAEIQHYNYLAKRRQIDDETALMLILN